MEKKKVIKYSDFGRNKENPFIVQAIEEIGHSTIKKYRQATGTSGNAILRAVDDTGTIVGHTSFIRQVEVDEEEFVKFYLRDFRVFFGLSEKAMRVFGYILTLIRPNSDEFIFLIDECLENTIYKTKVSIYAALTELIAAEIIARGKSDVFFFINPMVIFNGNRVTFAKTYVKKGTLKNSNNERNQLANKNQLELFDPSSND